MHNPFDAILAEINELKVLIKAAPSIQVASPPEIINTDELCKRLSLSEPTIIMMRKRKQIPFFKAGSSVRYNWPSVIDHLERCPIKPRQCVSKEQDYQKKYTRKKIDSLSDSYVLDKMKQVDLKNILSLKRKDIPKEIIEAKRQNLFIKREIKKQK